MQGSEQGRIAEAGIIAVADIVAVDEDHVGLLREEGGGEGNQGEKEQAGG